MPQSARAASSASIEYGARAERGVLKLGWAEAPGPLRVRLGALNLETMSCSVAAVGPHGHSGGRKGDFEQSLERSVKVRVCGRLIRDESHHRQMRLRVFWAAAQLHR